MTQQVKQNEGTVGYVELIYAISNGLPYADIQNAAGNFVEPTLASVSAAAASANLQPGTDFRVSITNPPGEAAYPIASFTWLLVRPESQDTANARILREFMTWMITPEAQRMATDLHYAPLPMPVIELVQERIGRL